MNTSKEILQTYVQNVLCVTCSNEGGSGVDHSGNTFQGNHATGYVRYVDDLKIIIEPGQGVLELRNLVAASGATEHAQ
jgi:hypothetical protein